jgi:hypothetical protein
VSAPQPMTAARKWPPCSSFHASTAETPRRPVMRSEGLLIARHFLEELLANRLEVCLTRAEEERHTGHMVRTVCSQNPDWYRHFCKLYYSNRRDITRWSKHKTSIKRRETVRALERILGGGASETLYTERLKDFIRAYGRKYAQAKTF